MRRPECRHCRRGLPIRARGLCSTCYHAPAVRARYATVARRGEYWPWGYEPTWEELERCEAEQRKRLPRWWAAEEAKMRQLDVKGLIPHNG